MLSVSSCNLAQASSYFEKDYYSQSVSGDNQTAWQGKLAGKLGLNGEVTEAQFRGLMQAQAAAGKTCVEHDLTFSAPKSVSIAAEMGDPELRAAVLEAHRAAVSDTLREIEKNVISTRIKANGEMQHIKTGNMAAATFEHSTARPASAGAAPDMDLHTHCAIANQTEYNGQMYAIDGKSLYDVQKRYGAEYRSRLAAGLQERGYQIHVTDPEKGFFEMDGIKPEVIAHFSQRRAQIEAELTRSGQSGAKAAQQAGLKTRAGKDKNIDMDATRAQWREELHQMGQDAPKKSADPIPKATPEARQEAFSHAVGGLEQSEYAFTQKDLETAILNQGVGDGMTRAHAQKLIAHAEKSGKIVNLGRVQGADPATAPVYFTTKHNIEQQEAIFQAVADGRGKAAALDPATAKASLDKVCKANGWQLAAEQERLVMHVATSPDQVIAVRGLAGTGKTFSLNAAREVLEANGYEVRGMSASGKAADELQQDAHLKDCGTIHSVMNRAEKAAGNAIPGEDYSEKKTWNFDNLKKPEKPCVILMDEASLTDNNTMYHALKLAQAQDAKLVLVGDDRQLLPVGAGNSFSELVQNNLVATTDLTAIQRQKVDSLRQAVVEAVKGDPEKTLDILAKGGNVTEIKTEARLFKAVSKEYCSRAPEMQQDTVILTATNATRQRLNAQIREDLKAQGKLQDGKNFEIQTGKAAACQREFAVGDKVAFFQNDNKIGVKNGTQGEVTGLTDKGLTVKIGNKQIVDVNMSQYNHVDHAYAITPHKGQGLTKGHAMPVLLAKDAKLNSRNSMYVDVSRAKFSCKIFTDNKEKVGKQVCQWAEKVTARSFAPRPKAAAKQRVKGKCQAAAPNRAAAKARGFSPRLSGAVLPKIGPAAKFAGGVAASFGKSIGTIGKDIFLAPIKFPIDAIKMAYSIIQTFANVQQRWNDVARPVDISKMPTAKPMPLMDMTPKKGPSMKM